MSDEKARLGSLLPLVNDSSRGPWIDTLLACADVICHIVMQKGSSCFAARGEELHRRRESTLCIKDRVPQAVS